MWDPEAPDELVVAEGFARSAGIRVGHTIAFRRTPWTTWT
jgi:hypothetical protein